VLKVSKNDVFIIDLSWCTRGTIGKMSHPALGISKIAILYDEVYNNQIKWMNNNNIIVR